MKKKESNLKQNLYGVRTKLAFFNDNKETI